MCQELQKRGAKDAPTIIACANYRDLSTNAVLNDEIIEYVHREDKAPIKVETIMRRIQPETYAEGDITFISDVGDEYEEIGENDIHPRGQTLPEKIAA